MFQWGEDCRDGFRQKKTASVDAGDLLDPGLNIVDLSVGRCSVGFVKSNGNAFIIRTTVRKDGTRAVQRQSKRVFICSESDQCKVKIQAVRCADESVTVLSEAGIVFCVDAGHARFIPRTPEALRNRPVSQVACGSQHFVTLTRDGQVYTWGQGSRGQLGLGEEHQDTHSPQHLLSLSAMPLVQISAGGEQSFALSVSGGVFGWGRNDCGQLGLGDRTDRHTPTSIHCLNKKKTVDVSCGNDHTVILTKTGAVFTFGSGKYGQLGHNSFRDEVRPRLVAELWGTKVTKIACGRHHTLALTASRRVYSFGCDEQGQLGYRQESHPSVPLPVQLPRDTTISLIISNIYAGENYSFATCTSLQGAGVEANTDNVSYHCIESGINKWMSKRKSKSRQELKKDILKTISSASCWNQSFLDQSNEKHFQTSPEYSGLNLSLAQQAFEKLAKKDIVLMEVEDAVLLLLPSLVEKPVGVEGLRIFLLLSELLHVTQSEELAVNAAAAMQRLSTESLRVIGDWWYSLSPSTMIKHVEAWKNAVSERLGLVYLSFDPTVTNLLLVLQNMYNANNRIAGCPRIPEKTFCLQIDQPFVEADVEHLQMVRSKNVDNQTKFLLDFPFLMDVTSKVYAFNYVAARSKGIAGPQWFLRIIGEIPHLVDHLKLRLKRATLWKDAFTQLAAAAPDTFKNMLVVYLDEDPKISNVYKCDLFHHVFNDMVSTQSDMFMFDDSKTLVWFPSKVTEEDKKTFLVLGVLCGLAMYNQCIMRLPFPLVLFKKLLDVEPTLEDLKEFSNIGRSLQDVLDYEDDVLQNLYMSYLIHWDGTEVDLDPQCPGKPVTSQNKKEFVDAYVNHVFNTSVDGAFQEFKRGFFQVCDQDLVKLFRAEELQELLVGKDTFDWTKLKENTIYSGGYKADHPTIQMFWEVFGELTEDQRKDFIWFLTGFRRVPVFGMDQIKMLIEVKQVQSDCPDQHYPESLTCYSLLILPLYSTKEVMRDRLTEALIPENVFLT
ncbi:probable E3 ubiquitin-protein ligase HERC3 isoform X2 [Antennarius striatus]|uniref:probable E3 ubiquitin-protein ligase HERC3 isoform X2 n=1 Tax=Antennarius striatus TaxID=241820 RepID=UPI0035AEBDF4